MTLLYIIFTLVPLRRILLIFFIAAYMGYFKDYMDRHHPFDD